MARDFHFTTIDPRDPTGPKIEVVLPGQLIDFYYKHYVTRFLNLEAAKCVLDDPKRIFFGVREYNEGGWCYVGRPERWYIRPNVDATFPQHLVFAVYVNPRMHIYECRAEMAAQDDPLSPVDWQNRYRGLVWKTTS